MGKQQKLKAQRRAQRQRLKDLVDTKADPPTLEVRTKESVQTEDIFGRK